MNKIRLRPGATAVTRHASRLITHWPLAVVVTLYLALAITHSLIAPLTVGNDEWAHFLYTRFIAEHGRLPTTLAERNEAGYKSDAPPLYHLLAATAAAGVEPVRLLRPLDAPRRYLADNIIDSYALVHTAVEQWPYRGEVLLWHLGRGLSILFGVGLIGVTYGTALLVFSGDIRLAALSAALVAFMPAVLFHSSVLSYESLSAFLTALFLLAALKAVRQPARWRWWLALGALAGLSITTKYSAVLLPLEIVLVAWLAGRLQRAGDRGQETGDRWQGSRGAERSVFLARSAAALLVMALMTGWWFGFVVWHFNRVETQGPLVGVLQPLLVGDASDTTSVQLAGFLFGDDGVMAEAREPLPRRYPQLLQQFLDSFWAAPVDNQFLLSPWLSLLFSGLAGLGLAGLWPLWRRAGRRSRATILLLLCHTLLIAPLLLTRILFSFDPGEVAQGRHLLLPAASAIAVLLVWGWSAWSPKIAPLTAAGLLAWSALGQVGWAAAVYPPPIPVWSQPPEALAAAAPVGQPLANGALELLAADWRSQPDELAVTLWWRAEAVMTADYLVQLRLVDPAGRLVGYNLGHPAGGRFPTRAWEPGDIIRDDHRLPLVGAEAGMATLTLQLLTPDGQPLPDEDEQHLGQVELPSAGVKPACQVWAADRLRPQRTILVYSQPSPALALAGGRRLEPLRSQASFHAFLVGPDWPAAGQVQVGETVCAALQFDIPARNFTAPEIPTPLRANFNHEIELLGYDLPTRRINPGGRLPLTLYWRALETIGEDYRLFANPLDAAQQRRGGYDRRPRDGYSTLRWVPGEVITDPFGIPIDADAPDGVYTIDLGWYRATEQGAQSLPLAANGQLLDQTSIRLGPVKVGGPPPGVVVNQPAPQLMVNQPLGDQISLLGYDLTLDPQTLELNLYWQADQRPAADYTRFFHLRDAAGHNVVQADSPPAGGRYPTGLWEPGEVVADIVAVSLAGLPPGEYRPVVGLYQPASGERLPTPGNPANEIPLNPLQLPVTRDK